MLIDSVDKWSGLRAKSSCENLRAAGQSPAGNRPRYLRENMTEAAVAKMEAQLKLWSLQIDELAVRTQMPGVRAGFEALMYIDELKVLHAIAQSKFDEFRAAGGAGQARLKTEMESACNELAAAFKIGGRRPKR